MKRNDEIRINCSSMLKAEVRNFCSEILLLNLTDGVNSLLFFALIQLNELLKEGYSLEFRNDYDRNIKIIKLKGGKP